MAVSQTDGAAAAVAAAAFTFLQRGDYLKAALRCSCTFEGGGRNSSEVLPTEVRFNSYCCVSVLCNCFADTTVMITVLRSDFYAFCCTIWRPITCYRIPSA
jgi:hypothetical protein